MKILLTITLVASGLLLTNSFAQTEEGSNTGSSNLFKRGEVSGSNENTTEKTTSKDSSTEKANPYHKTTDNSNSVQLAQPTPATRTSSNYKIEKIEYSLENNNSTLANLLNLIEIKEKVNKSGNQELKNSSEYNTLLSDINKLRNDFDSYVESKGIENCSTLEQSHYLAFLKEEGKEEAYKNAMAKLK